MVGALINSSCILGIFLYSQLHHHLTHIISISDTLERLKIIKICLLSFHSSIFCGDLVHQSIAQQKSIKNPLFHPISFWCTIPISTSSMGCQYDHSLTPSCGLFPSVHCMEIKLSIKHKTCSIYLPPIC